jgi:hypothetical protein
MGGESGDVGGHVGGRVLDAVGGGEEGGEGEVSRARRRRRAGFSTDEHET